MCCWCHELHFPKYSLQHPIFLKKKAIFKLQIVYFRCSLQMCFLYISEKKRPMNHDNCVGDDGSVKQNAWGSSFPQWSVLLLLPSLPAQHPIQPNARGRGRDIPCPAHAAPSWEPLARLGGPANHFRLWINQLKHFRPPFCYAGRHFPHRCRMLIFQFSLLI